MKSIGLKVLAICCAILIVSSCKNEKSGFDVSSIPVKFGEKWGYIDKKGEYIINPQFRDADFFRDGVAMVVSNDGKVGYIDVHGKYIITAKFKSGSPFNDGLAYVVNDGGYPTCINTKGETVFVLKQARFVLSFSEGLSLFCNNEKKIGFVDKSGKVVINPQFDEARSFSEGLAAVCQNKKWGFIDKSGKIIINPQFEETSDFHMGKAAFGNGDQMGFIDNQGKYIINPQFDEALSFSEGLSVIKSGDDFGYIAESGKIEINPQYEEAFSFSDNLAAVVQNGKVGYIDKSGKIAINPQFDNASSFVDKIAFVESSGKWGIINQEGKYLVNPQFELMKTEFGNIYYIQTDYYNCSEFLSSFFSNSTGTSFDNFGLTSTLQNIADHPTYGEYVKAADKYLAEYDKVNTLTNEIAIRKTSFYFNNPIYQTVPTYSSYFGYVYETGSTKNYNLSEKIGAIAYEFDFSGEAIGKAGSIAYALSSELEIRYKVKMTKKADQYYSYRDSAMSFAMIFNDYSLTFFVGFDKSKIEELVSSKNSDNEIAD